MYEGAKNNSTINQSISPTKEKLNFSFIDSLIDSLVESIDEEIKDIITVLSYIGWPVLNNKFMNGI